VRRDSGDVGVHPGDGRGDLGLVSRTRPAGMVNW
jgi:hypothetical protein